MMIVVVTGPDETGADDIRLFLLKRFDEDGRVMRVMKSRYTDGTSVATFDRRQPTYPVSHSKPMSKYVKNPVFLLKVLP